MNKILVINPGSTSTKLAIFEDNTKVKEVNLKMDENIVRATKKMMDQVDHRTELIMNFMNESGYKVDDFDMIACRGGFVERCPGGIYAVNDLMVDVLRYAPTSEHASSLAAVIGYKLAAGKIPVIICDSVVSDEMWDVARWTGIPEVKRKPVAHVLNSRFAAKEVAQKIGVDFNAGRFVVAHMGGGCSVSAYCNGKLVDCDYNMITPQRSGNIPNGDMIDLCFSGKYSEEQVRKMTIPEGGFYAYIGTQDALEAENRAKAGDELCQKLYEVMAYQISKDIGSMCAILGNKIDSIVLTGALARSDLLVDPITENFKTLYTVNVVPGERELEALAYAANSVLNGDAVPQEYTVIPRKFKDKAEFDAFVAAEKAK